MGRSEIDDGWKGQRDIDRGTRDPKTLTLTRNLSMLIEKPGAGCGSENSDLSTDHEESIM